MIKCAVEREEIHITPECTVATKSDRYFGNNKILYKISMALPFKSQSKVEQYSVYRLHRRNASHQCELKILNTIFCLTKSEKGAFFWTK